MVKKEEVTKPVNRIISLDQFRGFAIFGMILVIYLVCFAVARYMYKNKLVVKI